MILGITCLLIFCALALTAGLYLLGPLAVAFAIFCLVYHAKHVPTATEHMLGERLMQESCAEDSAHQLAVVNESSATKSKRSNGGLNAWEASQLIYTWNRHDTASDLLRWSLLNKWINNR